MATPARHPAEHARVAEASIERASLRELGGSDGTSRGRHHDVAGPLHRRAERRGRGALGEGGEQLHQWVYGLMSWREPHGLAGGKSNRDSEVLDEAKGGEAGQDERGRRGSERR
jgi:hypothetical protein